jgi:hypothetical protein
MLGWGSRSPRPPEVKNARNLMNAAAVVVEVRVQPDGALEVNQIGPTEW